MGFLQRPSESLRVSKWVSVCPCVHVSVFGVYLREPQVVGTYLKSSSQEGVLMLGEI